MEYAVSSAGLAHTYGNATAYMTEFIKGLFPPNYFKTVHINSTIAYREFNIFKNSRREFIKKQKPMLIIRPRLELFDNDNFLEGTYLTTRIMDNYMDVDFSNLQPFIENMNDKIRVKYLLNRIKMFFDVSIVVETKMEQINYAHYLKNRIRHDRPFFLQTSFENHIPREIISVYAKEVGLSLNNDDDVKHVLDSLNSNSYYPITYKMKNSTGNDEFFRFYPVNIDTTVSSLSLDDGGKKDMVDDAYGISFTVSTEFNTAGLYYYFTESPEVIDEIRFSMTCDQGKTIIPIFTISNLYDDIQMPPGWNMYISPMYKVDYTGVSDQLDFSSLINVSLKEAIKYHIDHNIPLDTFIQAFVMKDNKKMDITKGEYEIDFENLILTTHNANEVSTYRLIIYVNTMYINNLVADLLDAKTER